MEVQPIDCNPAMLAHPMALLRWFQLLMYVILQWLVQITCGNGACTMITNVFVYIAMGQLFVLLILLLMSITCVLIITAYGLNFHRSKFLPAILTLEAVYAVMGVVLFIAAAMLGTWMAVLTNDDEVNYQGRGKYHIRGQWIAAAVFEFLMIFLFMADFILQRRKNYPFIGKSYEKSPYSPMENAQMLISGAGPVRTNRITRSEKYLTQQSTI